MTEETTHCYVCHAPSETTTIFYSVIGDFKGYLCWSCIQLCEAQLTQPLKEPDATT